MNKEIARPPHDGGEINPEALDELSNGRGDDNNEQ